MPGALWRIESVRSDDAWAARMVEEIREGLTSRPPSLPCKYFYDDRGSRLFEDITRLPEYYQTRTEELLLAEIAGEVVERVRPAELVELGSGAGRKIRLLLTAMSGAGLLQRCTLLEINAAYLSASARALAASYPELGVRGVVGDFLDDLACLGPGGGRLAVFFAGTIGNLHPGQVPAFLARMAERLAPRDAFLVGLDLVKEVARLEAAYNDSAGVTADFNRNILRVMNDRLGADFDPEAFEHVAFYDPDNSWIEMRLRSARPQRVRVPAACLDLAYGAGDEIRTEISCKYTRASFEAMLGGTGLTLDRWYTDPQNLFALALLSPSTVRNGTSR